MRLKEEHRKSVVIIGCGNPQIDDDIGKPWGTAFLVGCTDPVVTYLVTAAHVLTREEMVTVPFAVRFNRKGGGARNYHIDEPAWVLHETDDTVDVAVHRIEIPDWADATFIRRDPTVLTEETMKSKNIGHGSRTYTVGLWKFMQGDRRNQPFVYTGHIGLIPEGQGILVESRLPLHSERRVEVKAYLVEGEPLNGASGDELSKGVWGRLKPTWKDHFGCWVSRATPFLLGRGKTMKFCLEQSALWCHEVSTS